MNKKIEHSAVLSGNPEKNALARVIKSKYLAQGRETEQFEKEMSEFIGCRYSVATSTGTAALHLALLSFNIKKGDEVIIPNYVCRSVLNAVEYIQAIPVLCDVDKQTFNIMPEDIMKKITRRTKAVIVAHMFGCPAGINKIKKLGIPVIEDCAQSIGAGYKSKKAGSIGDVSIFSFEGTKTITTGEGGMVLTNSRTVFERLSAYKEPYSKEVMPKYTYRLSDLQAAVGRVQLKRLPGFIRRREQIAKQYMKAFVDDQRVHVPFIPKGSRHSFHRFILTLKGVNLDQCLQACQKQGVMVKRAIKPFVLNQYLNIPDKFFPNTDYIMRHCASLPIYPALKNNEVKKVINTVKAVL